MADAEQAPRGWSPARLATSLFRHAGRPGAALVLALTLLLTPALESIGHSFLPLALFDLYQRIKPRPVHSLPVAIIDIDEAAIAKHGQWPWPRTLTARLIEQTASLGPLAIGLDFIMPEPDRLSPSKLVAQYPEIDEELRRTLDGLPSNDALLASVIERHRVIVGRAGLPVFRGTSPNARLPRTPFMVKGPDPVPHLVAFADQLANVPEVEAAAAGVGLVNAEPDGDGVLRRIPLVANVSGGPFPSLGLELLRAAFGARFFLMRGDEGGAAGVFVGQYFFPTEPGGDVRIYFSPPDRRRRLPALHVLAGTLPEGALNGQVALIGVSALGLTDAPPTPVAPRMDGVEIQAQFVENLVDGARLVRHRYASWVEASCLALAGLILIALLPRLRPAVGVCLWLGLLLVLFGSSFAAFALSKQIFDPIYPAISVSIVYMVLLCAMLAESIRSRRALDLALERERLASARMSGELDAAREIQMGMLPDPGAIEGLGDDVQLHAFMKPAREVGGDLYDAYMLDEQRLFILIGDVSGKGVGASLFMALSRTLCKTVALRWRGSLGDLMTDVNETISRENSGSLFVTAIAGVIDIRTGEVGLCNAGHDTPLLMTPDGQLRELKTAGGPPICVVEDFEYVAETFQLGAGESLLFWTDGVTEAVDTDARLYGRERIAQFLRSLNGNADPRAMVDGLYEDVVRFMNGAEPADDITIMAVQLSGAGRS